MLNVYSQSKLVFQLSFDKMLLEKYNATVSDATKEDVVNLMTSKNIVCMLKNELFRLI